MGCPYFPNRGVRLLLLLFLARLASGIANAQCYDAKGGPMFGWYPCDPHAYMTNCCPQGWACYSNHLCVVVEESQSYFPNLTAGVVARGACTNPDWNNSVCGDFCLDEPNVDGKMGSCGDNKFCCQGDLDSGDCRCESKDEPLEIKPGTPGPIIDMDAKAPATPSYLRATTNTPSSSSSIETVSPSATSTTEEPIPTGDTDSPEASETPAPGLGTKAKIGLGVGLGVAGIAAIMITALYLSRRIRRNRARSLGSKPVVVGPLNPAPFHNLH